MYFFFQCIYIYNYISIHKMNFLVRYIYYMMMHIGTLLSTVNSHQIYMYIYIHIFIYSEEFSREGPIKYRH